jgi:hypothetical protein
MGNDLVVQTLFLVAEDSRKHIVLGFIYRPESLPDILWCVGVKNVGIGGNV